MKYALKPIVAASAIAITAFATTATALPLDELFFSQSAGWVDPTDADPGTSYNGSANTSFSMLDVASSNCSTAGPVGTSSGMSWVGTGSGEGSSICINSFDSTASDAAFGGLNQGGDSEWNENEFWVITELIQENNVLFGTANDFPNPLWVADTMADFFVYEDAVGGVELIDDSGSTTRIEFWETVNTVNWDNCNPSDPYNGLVPAVPGADACADRYRVGLGTFANVESGPTDGYIYTVSFTLVPGPVSSSLGGAPLGETIVDVDPLGDGQFIDVYTPEIAPGFSSLYVAASWSVREVPEPSVLALFGAGILGLGLANRRRKQRS